MLAGRDVNILTFIYNAYQSIVIKALILTLKYDSIIQLCNAFSGQMQQKLNRVASSAGSAPLAVSIAAILEVTAEVQEKRARRKREPEQVH